MFQTVFATGCPFASYFIDTRAGRKSFVRTINRLERAIAQYNFVNAYDVDNPNYIWLQPIRIYDKPDLNGVVAYAVANVGRSSNFWPVSIIEYEE